MELKVLINLVVSIQQTSIVIMVKTKQEKSRLESEANDVEVDEAVSSQSEIIAPKVKLEEGAEETSSSGSSASESEVERSSEKETSGRLVDWTGQAIPKTKTTDIHNRLTSFFSQLAEQRAQPQGESNEVIEHGTDSDSGYEEDNDGKQYVELDLALGVLSEQHDGGDNEVKLPKSEPEDDERGTESEKEALRSLRSVKKRQRTRGEKAKRRKIEEVG